MMAPAGTVDGSPPEQPMLSSKEKKRLGNIANKKRKPRKRKNARPTTFYTLSTVSEQAVANDCLDPPPPIPRPRPSSANPTQETAGVSTTQPHHTKDGPIAGHSTDNLPMEPELAHDTDRPRPRTNPCLSITLLNTVSAAKHAAAICDYIIENDIDIMALTETRLKDSSGPILDILVPPKYSITRADRASGFGGGVAIIHRESLTVHETPLSVAPDCESLSLKISLDNFFTINVLLIYRPPGCRYDISPPLLEQILASSGTNTGTILLGDFNLKKGNASDREAAALETSLHNLEFTVHPDAPTHSKGNTLDWVSLRNLTLQDLSIRECPWSDHHSVDFKINLPHKPLHNHRPHILVHSRNYNKISKDTLTRTMASIIAAIAPSDSPDHMVSTYCQHLSTMVETHAPLTRKTVRDRARSNDWSNDEVQAARTAKRRAERRWRSSGSLEDRTRLRTKSSDLKRSITMAKKEYINVSISKSKNKSKGIFKALKNLESPLPSPLPSLPQMQTAFELRRTSKIKSPRLERKLAVIP